MNKVEFYDIVDDSLLKFAVIVCKCKEKWVLCRQKKRNTYEFPGGHREPGEDIILTARRELYEETGALVYSIQPICAYSVMGLKEDQDQEKTYGMLYYADILQLGEMPDYEMETVVLFEHLPNNWTYPEIQPALLQKITDTKKVQFRDLYKKAN